MSETKQQSNVLDNIVGIVIGIPMALIVFVLSLPWLLYHVVVKFPIDNSKKRKFLRRNEGKTLLCITTSLKYDSFVNTLMEELKGIGIHNVVVFNGEISNNYYDNYDWDRLIKRKEGFPLLLKIHRSGINQSPLKTDFSAFFKKEIDVNQLIQSIKLKMTQIENE